MFVLEQPSPVWVVLAEVLVLCRLLAALALVLAVLCGSAAGCSFSARQTRVSAVVGGGQQELLGSRHRLGGLLWVTHRALQLLLSFQALSEVASRDRRSVIVTTIYWYISKQNTQNL